jgi:tetratricopeptide (TPR) repeat protein
VDAAEAVSGPGALAPLIRLVDHSLVSVSDGPRYHLPESVAAYASERLAEAGEAETVLLRHHAHYTELAERAAPRLRGADQSRWLAVLDRETANLRVALQRAVQRRDGPGAARLALALSWYWSLHGRLREARRSLEDALSISEGVPQNLRAQALLWHTGFLLLTGAADQPIHVQDGAHAEWFLGYALFTSGQDLPRSEQIMESVLARFRADGDIWGIAAAESTRARQALVRGDLDALRESGEHAHELFTELGDRWGLLQTSFPLAALAEITGDYAQAARLHRDGFRLAEDLGFWTDAADRLTGAGRIALLTGDFPQADDLHRKAMRLATEHGYTAGAIHAEIGLALIARRQGRLDDAEKLLTRLLDWHRGNDFGPGPALLLAELGFVAEQRGDASAALELHSEGLAIAESSGDPRAIALAYEGLAGAHVLAGDPAKAARRLETATRLREEAGAPLPQAERGDVDRITARTRSTLA